MTDFQLRYDVIERAHLTQVSIVTFKYFFTYLLSDAQHPKMRISWAAIIFKCFKLPNPFYSFYLTWDNINSYTTLYHSVQYHTTLYCFFRGHGNVHYTIVYSTILRFIVFLEGTVTNLAIWLVLYPVSIFLSLPTGHGNTFVSRRVHPNFRRHFS